MFLYLNGIFPLKFSFKASRKKFTLTIEGNEKMDFPALQFKIDSR